MNTVKRVVLFIGTCVAVLLTTSCSAVDADSPTQSGERPPFIAQTPVDYDLWKLMNSGETFPEMAELATVFGLEAVNLPVEEQIELGIVGVAKLGEYCVLSFSESQAASGLTLIDMTMFSRYNEYYAMVMPALPPENVPEMIDKYRAVCAGDADFPSENIVQSPEDDAQQAA